MPKCFIISCSDLSISVVRFLEIFGDISKAKSLWYWSFTRFCAFKMHCIQKKSFKKAMADNYFYFIFYERPNISIVSWQRQRVTSWPRVDQMLQLQMATPLALFQFTSSMTVFQNCLKSSRSTWMPLNWSLMTSLVIQTIARLWEMSPWQLYTLQPIRIHMACWLFLATVHPLST